MIAIERSKALLREARTPRLQLDANVEKTVDDIIADVRARGDQALIDYAARFDGAKLNNLFVAEAEFEAAFEAADPALIAALEGAKANIEAFHARQTRQGFSYFTEGGAAIGQRVIPLRRAGLYIPGGTASYPSSVLMNALPAKIAGVSEIIMATPPARDGGVSPAILCAARIAGVDKILKSGGAQAIAALAYGTESVPAVDKIVGPGNAYVAMTKRRVFGAVDIDMIAGPSEILIVADAQADPECLAADMLGQSEHGALSSAILITDDQALAEAVDAALDRRVAALPRGGMTRAALESNGRIIVADDISEAVELSNGFAPEHLELCVDDPFKYLGRVINAASVFLGRYAPEALGDYWAGPNHTLPTGGTARFSSPLSVDDFVKKSSFVYYTREALAAASAGIVALAESEGLRAHAESVTVRLEGGR